MHAVEKQNSKNLAKVLTIFNARKVRAKGDKEDIISKLEFRGDE